MTAVRFFSYFFGIVGIIFFLGAFNAPQFFAADYMIVGLMLIFGGLYFNKYLQNPKAKPLLPPEPYRGDTR